MAEPANKGPKTQDTAREILNRLSEKKRTEQGKGPDESLPKHKAEPEGIMKWLTDSKKKLIIASAVIAVVGVGYKISSSSYEEHKLKTQKEAAVKIDKEKKDKAEADKKAMEKAKADAEKKAKEDKERKIEKKAGEISARCTLLQSDGGARDKPKAKPSLTCLSEDEIQRIRTRADLQEQIGNFRKAGLLYVEIGELKKAKEIIAKCKKDDGCEKDFKEASEIMVEAIDAAMKKKE